MYQFYNLAIRAARERVRQFGDRSSDELVDPSTEEEQECGELGRRLGQYFGTAADEKPIDIHPMFPGCGFIDAGAGDVHSYGTLYEVKERESVSLNGCETIVDLRRAEQSEPSLGYS
jgi:hypothetical protein